MIYNCSFPFSEFVSLEAFILLVILGFGLFIYSFYKLGFLKRYPNFALSGLALLSIGGSYNLSTRYLKGCVRDPYAFFDIFSFNFADVLVNLGFALLFLVYIMDFVVRSKGQKYEKE